MASGAAALAYEIVWGRWLATVLGASTLATSVVLACYMGGLAAGAWFFGRFSARTATPLRIYAFVEALIAVLAIAFPVIADVTVGLASALRLIVAVAVLLLPTFLMGGTLPLVVAWSEHRGLPEGETLARLYGLNTVGAALGCCLTGFVLIPVVGLEAANLMAAATNITIAAIALVLSRRLGEGRGAAPPRAASEPSRAVELPSSPSPWLEPLLVVAFLSGFVTLGLEVLWIRHLRILLGSTTYTFTLVIALFILGLGAGGLWAGRLDEEAPVIERLATRQGLLLLLLAGQFVALPFAPRVLEALQGRSLTFEATLVYTVVVSTVLLLPLTLVIGYLFPLLGRLFMMRGHRGEQVGRLYTINTAGAVLGALSVSLVLVPTIGSANAYAVFLLLAGASLAIYLHIAEDGASKPRWRRLRNGGLVLGAAVLVLVAWRPGWSARNIAFGVGWTTTFAESDILLFTEGRGSTVVVEQNQRGHRTIRIDGKPVASTFFNDRINELLLGHLPALLTPRVERGLVIGLGSGITTGALSLHDPAVLHQIEIEPRVAEGARLFAAENFAVLDHPAFELIVDDGYNYLSATDLTYDVITSDPIQPYFRGAATLYSVNYFRLAHDHLTEQGVMAHWLPLGNLGPEDFTMVVRSFVDAFPHARLYWAGGGPDGILIGRRTPFETDPVVPERWASAKDSLRAVFLASADEVGSLLMADREVLVAWAGDGPLNRLDHPRLEFTAPKSQYVDTFITSYEALRRMRSMRPFVTPSDHAIWGALSYATQVEYGSVALADRLLFDLAPCPGPLADCAAVRTSGLYRRLLFRRALHLADRALNGFLAHRTARQHWLGAAPPLPCGGERIETSLGHYATARALADSDEERERLSLRVEQTKASAPDCVPLLSDVIVGEID